MVKIATMFAPNIDIFVNEHSELVAQSSNIKVLVSQFAHQVPSICDKPVKTSVDPRKPN